MDNLKKQREKRVKKIVEKSIEDFQEGINRLELDRLYERKQLLKLKINSDTSETNKAIARLQLSDVEKSIDLITKKIDIYRDIDLDCDEDAAKKYIKDNPDIFIDVLDFEFEE